MAEIRAKPKHLFSWSFDLYREGLLLASFDMSWLREGGRFDWSGREYRLSREGLWSGDFLLTTGPETPARAHKESPFTRRFIVHTGGRELTLEAPSLFLRRFQLVEQDTVLGSIVPDHLFSRACRLELPQDFDVPVQVFLFWLVALMWRRAANSAACSS